MKRHGRTTRRNKHLEEIVILVTVWLLGMVLTAGAITIVNLFN